MEKTTYGTLTTGYTIPKQQNCCYSMWTIFAVAISFFLFDSVALAIGIIYGESPCFNEVDIITLANYLIIFSSISMGLMITILIFFMCQRNIISCNNSLLSCELFVASVLIYGVFTIVMIGIGINELVHQYRQCLDEVKIVAVMALIMMIIKSFKVISSCCMTECCDISCASTNQSISYAATNTHNTYPSVILCRRDPCKIDNEYVS